MFHGTLTKKQRLDLYCRLPAIHKMMHTESGSSNGVVVEKKVRKMLERNPDGPPTVYNFWSGEVAIRATELGQEDTTKVYEYLALVSALMFTVSVAFYVENPGGPGTHFYGIVSCISNCALWMATLSSTLFTVVIHSLRSDEQLELLVDLFGPCLMRVPMMLFVWGTALIFIQFVLFFKISVDPGFPCTMCLTMCFLIAPLFFHTLHKMSWAVAVIRESEDDHQRRHHDRRGGTDPRDLETALESYAESKGGFCLSMDKEEFMRGLHGAVNKASLTSVEKEFASQLFDSFIQRKVAELLPSGEETAMGFAIVNGNTTNGKKRKSNIPLKAAAAGAQL